MERFSQIMGHAGRDRLAQLIDILEVLREGGTS
jgi:hypothetical protein